MAERRSDSYRKRIGRKIFVGKCSITEFYFTSPLIYGILTKESYGMYDIKKLTPFGDTLLSWQTYSNNGKGLKVICPIDGYCAVCTDTNKTIVELSAYTDGIIAPKKKLFGKRDDTLYTVYFIAQKSVSVKGYVQIMGHDFDYGNVSTEYNIVYDLKLGVERASISEFIHYVHSENILSPVASETLKQKLLPHLNSVIQSVLGKHLERTSATLLQSDAMNIANEIKVKLNDKAGYLHSNGMLAEAFSFGISEEFEHREEKKRAEHNSQLKTY